MKRSRRVLTPLDISTIGYWLTGSGRQKCSADSADGIWHYRREESTGTPWLAEHVPSGTIPVREGTLDDAREATALISARQKEASDV